MRDLAVHDQDLIVATHGRAFWILDDIGPRVPWQTGSQRCRAPEARRGLPHSAQHRDGYAHSARRTPGRNPPSGAIIDYYLPRAEKQALRIEVLDSGGKLVRRVQSTDVLGPSPEERAREMIPAYWMRQPSPLATAAGAHRFIWDLHATTPRAARRGYPIAAVPAIRRRSRKAHSPFPATTSYA